MYKYSENRVVMVENPKSDWYEKVIFILRKDISPKSMPKNIVKEAEDIIESYIRTNIREPRKETSVSPKVKKDIRVKKITNRSRDIILNWCLILSSVLFIYYIFEIFD